MTQFFDYKMKDYYLVGYQFAGCDNALKVTFEFSILPILFCLNFKLYHIIVFLVDYDIVDVKVSHPLL